MYMDELFLQSISVIKGVGVVRAKLFAKLGIDNVGSLLRCYPRDYEDWRNCVALIDAMSGEPVYLKARIDTSFDEHRVRGGMTLYTCRASDENGTALKLTFFNNPYIGSVLKKGEWYILHGKVSFDYTLPQMNSPAAKPYEHCDGLSPKYPQTEKLPSRVFEQTVKYALAMLPDPLPDPLPEEVRERCGLCGLRQAIIDIHQPPSHEALAIARRRLVFDELLELQLGLLSMKGRTRSENALRLPADHSSEFLSLLPFTPTDAQSRAIADAMGDMMSGEHPMARLLQGDVGSGKTVVAAALCYCCARCGLQSALMVPTELLAEQHYKTLSNLLSGSGISVALLTGSLSPSEKADIHSRLSNGEIDVAIGTHALISEGVSYKSLGLVITDEQHRFGVAQRAALCSKGDHPHMLVMSATPIPRTLALMIFGDLDVSVLDELPKGRQPVDTLWIDSKKRERAYGFIRKQLDEGGQAYIVCPLVEENDSELMSAEEYAAKLANDSFADYTVAVLHGRMKSGDKEYIMRRFAAGDIQLLVSTTVIEVGVDVPNASIMLIENAERFGLSQLHQLRGRVGRGERKSYCILVSDSRSETSCYRMKVMCSTNDGFEISQEDLKLRGPGDFFGSRQHGLPNLRLADLATDAEVFAIAQREAVEMYTMYNVQCTMYNVQ